MKWPSRLLFGSFFLWILVIVVGFVGLAVVPPDTTFGVTAQSDRVHFWSEEAPASRWVLDDIEVFDAAKDSSFSFSGFFEPGPFIDVRIERIGLGPLAVDISVLPPSPDAGEGERPQGVGRLLGLNEEAVLAAGSRLYLFADSFPYRSRAGRTLLIPVSGTVSTGREVMIETNRTTAVLRSGSVALLTGSLFGLRNFEARRVPLGLGDRFVLTEPADQSLGFVVVDERPSLSVAYRAIGTGGRIDRAGGSSFLVDVSWFDRAVHDPLFQAVSFVMGLLAATATLLMLYLTWRPALDVRQDSAAESSTGRVRELTKTDGQASEPESAPPQAEGCAILMVLLGLLLGPVTALEAQQSVYIRAAEEGQGVLRARAATCFAVVPAHVLENAAGGVEVVGTQGLRSTGDIEMIYEIDLALVRLRDGGELTCTSWDRLPDLAPLLRSGGGYLLGRGAQGVETRTPVEIRRVDEDYVTVRASGEEIRQGMSGSTLVVEGVATGLLLSVCSAANAASGCEPGEADVLRMDAVKRYTDGFFVTQSPTSAVDQRNAQAIARQDARDYVASANRRQDSMMMARRGGRAPDLPNLKRDVEGLSLYAMETPINVIEMVYPNRPELHRQRVQWGDMIQDYGEREGRLLVATLSLSRAVLSSAETLPAPTAACSLHGSSGGLRDFEIYPRDSERGGPSAALLEAVAWGDTGEALPPGEYWIECTIDGEVFESGRMTLGLPIRPWGEFTFRGGGVGQVGQVRLLAAGTETSWEVNPAGGLWEVDLAANRRPDAEYAVSFDVSQTSGPAPAGWGLESLGCRAVGALSETSNSAVEPLGTGSWRVSTTFRAADRVRAGDRSLLTCGWGRGGGLAFFQILVEFS